MVLPIWLTIGLREDDLLSSSFETYYPLAIAMIFGSMIAGSTPIGGAVVAFPVSVLFIGFTASQGRDFSLMIQSVGMTAASFLIFLTKPDLMIKYGELVATSTFFSLIGLIIGFQMTISSFVVMCIYTTTTAAFALILAYVEECLQKSKDEESLTENQESLCDSISTEQKEPVNTNMAADIEEERNDMIIAKESDTSIYNSTIDLVSLIILSFFGGIISSQIGTGSDITWYAFGSLVYNSRKYNNKISSNELTAASIIIMTMTSIFGAILRASTTGATAPTKEVYQALIACSCLVVIGAPLGSLFLSENNQKRLKILFYVLALVQLVTFGILKVKMNVLAWSIIGGLLFFVCSSIAVMDYLVFKTGFGDIISRNTNTSNKAHEQTQWET